MNQVRCDIGSCYLARFLIYRGRPGRFRCRIIASNGRILASSESYEAKVGPLNAINVIKQNAASAPIQDAA
jgi:uncharacterized protein